MSKERGLIVADFDGTIACPHKGRASYEDSAYNFISQEIRIPRAETDARMATLKKHVLENQEKYGWKINGIIVSPPADFILVNQAAAELLVKQLGEEKTHSLTLPKEEKMDDFIYRILKSGYAGMKDFFRDGAKDFVEKYSKEGRFAVVTNSSTDRAASKLKLLIGENNIPVYGNARKFEVDLNWEDANIPVSQTPEGFPVTEYLRRPKYFAVLDELKPEIVIGDIRHLDLILPEFMGIYTALALSKYTPKWEITHHVNHNNSVVFDDFSDLDI